MVGKTILLVEDNPDLVTLTLRALKRGGLQSQVVIARDGAEALDYLFGRGTDSESDGPVLPYLVLLDLNLPKVNGLGVLQHIRSDERTRLLPVVILTSSTREEDILTS